MEVVPLGSAPEIAMAAADIIEAVVRRKPAAVLGLACLCNIAAEHAEFITLRYFVRDRRRDLR